MAKLKALPIASQIVEYVVCAEFHEDGTPHNHAFVKYEKKVAFGPRRWDLDGFHGDYEPAKSWTCVSKYVAKGKNWISSFDPFSAIAKKGKNNKELLETDPKELVDTNKISIFQLPHLMKAKAFYALLQPALETDGVRGIWIHGPPRAGKSHAARKNYSVDGVFVKAQNKWWDGYGGEKVVVLDDFDKKGEGLSHYLKIWTDKWACTGEVKGFTVPLLHEKFIITSNYLPKDIWPSEDDDVLREAIESRFEFIFMANMNEYLGKRKPIIN